MSLLEVASAENAMTIVMTLQENLIKHLSNFLNNYNEFLDQLIHLHGEAGYIIEKPYILEQATAMILKDSSVASLVQCNFKFE